jgi:cytochrome c oxidase subunit 1
MLDDRLGKIHFWLVFIGFHTTFLVHHWLGAAGMQRRVVDYDSEFTALNILSSLGSFVLGGSTLLFIFNVYRTMRHAPRVEVDDPWGFGNSLEWATSCPPPRHNFHAIPKIRSERPAFDLHYPRRPPPEVEERAH